MTYFSILKVEAICSSEVSVDFQWSTRHYVLDARTLYNDGCWTNLSLGRISQLQPPCNMKVVYILYKCYSSGLLERHNELVRCVENRCKTRGVYVKHF